MIVLILTVIAGSGCATKTEYVYIKPECSVPPMVSEADLPNIDVDYVYDNLGTEVAEDLLKRERLIVDSLLEHRAILKEICDEKD